MWKRLLPGLSILIGLAALGAIPFLVGVHEVFQTIRQVGWTCLILSILNASGTLLIPALGWWIILRAEGIRVSPAVPIQANLMGFPLNMMTPSMFLGGEPLKVVYLSTLTQRSRRHILATIIIAKLQELGGLLGSMLLVTALFLWHTHALSAHAIWLLMIGLSILASLFSITLYGFLSRTQPLVKSLLFLSRWRIFPRLMHRMATFAGDLETLIHGTLTRQTRAVFLAQSITWLSTISIFLRPWIFFRALPHAPVGFEQLCLFFVFTNLVNALTIIPGGLGIFEATMTGYAAFAGLGDDKGAAFAIVTRLSDGIFFAIGCWLMLHHGLTRLLRKGSLAETTSSTDFPQASTEQDNGQKGHP